MFLYPPIEGVNTEHWQITTV